MFHLPWNSILSWALAAFFVLGGVINVLALGSTTAEYRRWGYPDWFHFATGALEFATATLLALTTTRCKRHGDRTYQISRRPIAS
jgi:DoxX-like family